MEGYKPPFTITNSILSYVASISEKVGRITVMNNMENKPHLRRNNRIKSIHSSLKIEANSLSLSQVRDVINGKVVLGEQKEIQEVKNAYNAYEKIAGINPYSIKDLKNFHGIMTKYIVEESGDFRRGEEGVFNGEQCIFMAPPAQFVPQLMNELFDWMKEADGEVHSLILSSVFHYEFELIHPFSDGNGRIGRLWHTLLLSQWNSAFAWLPVESIIYSRQREYYNVINASNEVGESTVFIEFMLSAIKAALLEVTDIHDRHTDIVLFRQDKIETYLKAHEYIMNADVRELCNVSAATANRILSAMVRDGKIVKAHKGKYWVYKLNHP